MIPYFHHPWYLLLLLLIPLLGFHQLRLNKKRKASIRFPSLNVVKKVPSTFALKLRSSLLVIRLVVLILMIVAMARPQRGESREDTKTHGVDIVLALDISSSMSTLDFKPKNRLNVAKKVVEDFVLGRVSDRIGLVVFAGKSFTQCPLTLDYGILIQFLKSVEFGMVEDGTAIGTSLLNCANRLRNSEAKSKVIILLTDGENTAGEVDPLTAAQAVKTLGIKVHTIGVGKEGNQPREIEDEIFGKRIVMVTTKIDEQTLKGIADITGGQYFRAQNPKSLAEIYSRIDKMEKTEIETNNYTRYYELFSPILWVALALLFLEIVLANTRFMKLP